jgi:tryptophanyl-tRNA synthetase
LSEAFKVTPWEVAGRVDYQRLVEEFGTQVITPELKKRMESQIGGLPTLLRRDVFFSHRDLDLILSDHETGKGFFVYTGRGPSGKMHVGHVLPFYFAKWIQEKFGANVYIQLTDDEKFLEENRRLNLNQVQDFSADNILDIAAVGFDEDKTFVFQNTEYIHHMYKLAIRAAKRINVSLVNAVFGFNTMSNIGLVFFPALQIVPTFFETKRCLIPAAIDQDPYWRIQRDLAEDLGYYKASEIHCKFLPPLSGPEGKMSTSDPRNAVFLSDSKKVVTEKIFKYAFSGGRETTELQRKHGGNPDVDVSFQWLNYFFEDDDKRLAEIERDYRSGKLLSGELKEILVEKVTAFIVRHQKARETAAEAVNALKYDGKLARNAWKIIRQ